MKLLVEAIAAIANKRHEYAQMAAATLLTSDSSNIEYRLLIAKAQALEEAMNIIEDMAKANGGGTG